jgi:endoglucanase
MSNTRIIISLFCLLTSFGAKAQIIVVSQVGYQINAPKIAAVINRMEAGKCNLIIGTSGSGKSVLTKCIVGIFTPDSGDVLYSGESMLTMNKHTNGTKFFITNISGTDPLFSGQLQPARNDVYANNIPVQLADFSAFQQSGTLHLIVRGAINKPQIIIQSLPVYTVGKAVLKGYYYQRASMPLLPQYAGVWAWPAGHPDNAVLIHESAASNERPAGSTIATPGGWYDAGDYNKYVVNSGITMYTLLSAYAHYATYFDTLTTNIPETGNGLPDIINELLYNLRWMLTMQDTDWGV